MTLPSFSASIRIDRSPADVFALVADITRMGEWSPVCKACWWDEGAEPGVGAWFSGRNETPERTWETRSQVVSYEPDRRFGWRVNGNLVHWEFSLEPVEGGTELTEHWEMLPALIDFFAERYGDRAQAELDDREQHAHTGIPVTLAAIKTTAESS